MFTSRQGYLALFVVVEEGVGLSLKAIRATSLSGIKFVRCKISHNLPVTITLEDVFKSVVTDISNVKSFVFFVKEKSARCDKPIA